MAGDEAMDGLPSERPSLPIGAQSQTSSVPVPLDNWAQHPTLQLSAIYCFWEGTSRSGGDPPSRVRAWPRGAGFAATEGSL